MTLMFEMETKLNYAAWSDGFLRKRLLFPLRFWFWFWFCSSSHTVSCPGSFCFCCFVIVQL